MMLHAFRARSIMRGPARAAVRALSTGLSDSAVLEQLASGKMAFHKLEAELGDPVRAMRLRREHLIECFGPGTNADAVKALPSSALDAAAFYGQVDGACCENVIGYVPLPVGTVGPYTIDGREVFVPMATTEGALVASTHRGARAISMSGGAHTELLADGMTRAPALALPSLKEAAALKRWLEAPSSLAELNEAFTSTSRFGRLLAVKVGLAGRYAHVRFKCFTGDAMGMNMVSKGVNKVVESILAKVGAHAREHAATTARRHARARERAQARARARLRTYRRQRTRVRLSLPARQPRTPSIPSPGPSPLTRTEHCAAPRPPGLKSRPRPPPPSRPLPCPLASRPPARARLRAHSTPARSCSASRATCARTRSRRRSTGSTAAARASRARRCCPRPSSPPCSRRRRRPSRGSASTRTSSVCARRPMAARGCVARAQPLALRCLWRRLDQSSGLGCVRGDE
jgi:hypothetical protein